MLKNSELVPRSKGSDDTPDTRAVLWMGCDYIPYDPDKDQSLAQLAGVMRTTVGATMNLAPYTSDKKYRTPFVSSSTGKKMPMSVIGYTGQQLLELWNINRDHEFSHLVSMMVKDLIFSCDSELTEFFESERELADFSHFDEFLTMICDYFFENKKSETYACSNPEGLVENITTFYRHHSLHYFDKLKKYSIPRHSIDDIGTVELKYYVCFIDPAFRDIISQLVYLLEEWFAYLGGVSKKLYEKRVQMGLASDRSEYLDIRYSDDRINDYLVIESIRNALIEGFADDSYERYLDWETAKHEGQQLRISDFLQLMNLDHEQASREYYLRMVKKLRSRKGVNNDEIQSYEAWKDGYIGEFEFTDLMKLFESLHAKNNDAFSIISHAKSVLGDTISISTTNMDGENIEVEFSTNYLLSWYHNWNLGGKGTKKRLIKSKQIFQTYVYAHDPVDSVTVSKTDQNRMFALKLRTICAQYVDFVRKNETPERLIDILESHNKSVAEQVYDDAQVGDSEQLSLF
jgi:hypothetical protein